MNAMKMKNKVESVRWQMAGNEAFKGRFTVNRRPFGEFIVEILVPRKYNPISVWVRSPKYEHLYWQASCLTLESVVEKLEERFENIGALAQLMQQRYDEIMAESVKHISKAIETIMENGDVDKPRGQAND